MKKLINIALIALISFVAVGCETYSDYTTPKKDAPYTDADFADCEIVSIKQFKEQYKSVVGTSANEKITQDWVIRGKVISSDESGNIYKSLFIQDDDAVDGIAGIELRLFTSNYTKYPIGYTVYVKLKDLSVGDYRGMISIGAFSDVEGTEYPHTTIENRITVNNHIFLGEKGEITDEDIKVVTESNYASFSHDDYLACLVRFEGLESVISGDSRPGVKWTTNSYPSYFLSADDNFNWKDIDLAAYPSWGTPAMAYKGKNPVSGAPATNYYYGSAWYSYDYQGDYKAQYVVRLSAYARFKDREIPSDGTKVNITSILTQYLSGKYTTYQIVPRFDSDIEIIEDAE